MKCWSEGKGGWRGGILSQSYIMPCYGSREKECTTHDEGKAKIRTSIIIKIITQIGFILALILIRRNECVITCAEVMAVNDDDEDDDVSVDGFNSKIYSGEQTSWCNTKSQRSTSISEKPRQITSEKRKYNFQSDNKASHNSCLQLKIWRVAKLARNAEDDDDDDDGDDDDYRMNFSTCKSTS